MSATVSFAIRDGVDDDILECLRLDHSYETDFVWQMQESAEDGWRIDFKRERLPRALEVAYPTSEDHLRAALPADQCFLVATRRDEDEILGYLAMRSERHYGFGLVQQIVVARPYRRREIGSRLIKIAARWAKERQLSRITVETQTKNYPAISFCQAAGFSFCGFNDHYFPNRDIAVFFSQSVR